MATDKNIAEKCKMIYHIGAVIFFALSLIMANNFISKDKQVDVAHAIRLDKINLFRDASTLVTMRYFDQQRIIWKLKGAYSSNDLSDDDIKKLDEMFNDCMESVREYNIKVRMISQQIMYIFNEDISKILLNESDKSCISNTFISIHDRIFKLKENSWKTNNHKIINELKDDSYKLSNKIDKLIKGMAELTFAKDKILEEYSL